MSRIGALLTGAGVETIFPGQSQCAEYLVIGSVGDGNIQALTVEIDGQPFINVRGAAVLQAYGSWLNNWVTNEVGIVFKLATGMIKKNTTYRITNNAAATPSVFVFSDSQNGIPFVASTKGINPSSFEDFNRFSALFVNTTANLDNAQIDFADGHSETMTVEELRALYATKQPLTTLADTTIVITNNDQTIKNVRLFANANAGGLTVLIAKLPDAAFKALAGSN